MIEIKGAEHVEKHHGDHLHKTYSEMISQAVRRRVYWFGREVREELEQEVWIELLADARRGVVLDQAHIWRLADRRCKAYKRAVSKQVSLRTSILQRTGAKPGGEHDGLSSLLGGGVSRGSDPAQELFARRDAAELSRVLRRTLTATQLEVLKWRVGRGAEVLHTAAALKLSPASVKNEQCRGLRAIRKATNGGQTAWAEPSCAARAFELLVGGLGEVSVESQVCA